MSQEQKDIQNLMRRLSGSEHELPFTDQSKIGIKLYHLVLLERIAGALEKLERHCNLIAKDNYVCRGLGL